MLLLLAPALFRDCISLISELMPLGALSLCFACCTVDSGGLAGVVFAFLLLLLDGALLPCFRLTFVSGKGLRAEAGEELLMPHAFFGDYSALLALLSYYLSLLGWQSV